MSDADLFAGWEAQFDDVEGSDAEDFSKLSDLELIQRLTELDKELTERKELLHQTTDRGRELSSLRSAIVVIMNTRR